MTTKEEVRIKVNGDGTDVENHMSQTLERLTELYYQQFASGYASPCRPFDAKALPDQLESELEVSEEYFTLSKEVAAYYKLLVETLAETGVLTVDVVQPTRGGAVFEVSSVLPEHKSFFNAGKDCTLLRRGAGEYWERCRTRS